MAAEPYYELLRAELATGRGFPVRSKDLRRLLRQLQGRLRPLIPQDETGRDKSDLQRRFRRLLGRELAPGAVQDIREQMLHLEASGNAQRLRYAKETLTGWCLPKEDVWRQIAHAPEYRKVKMFGMPMLDAHERPGWLIVGLAVYDVIALPNRKPVFRVHTLCGERDVTRKDYLWPGCGGVLFHSIAKEAQQARGILILMSLINAFKWYLSQGMAPLTSYNGRHTHRQLLQSGAFDSGLQSLEMIYNFNSSPQDTHNMLRYLVFEDNPVNFEGLDVPAEFVLRGYNATPLSIQNYERALLRQGPVIGTRRSLNDELLNDRATGP